MPWIELICLANSRKYRGRCVAGLATDGSGWVRPISSDPYGTLQPHHYQLPDGRGPQLLDVIQVSVIAPKPDPNQSENWLLDDSAWRLISRPALSSLLPLILDRVATGPLLFGSSGDRLTEAEWQSKPAEESLTLVRPQGLHWQVRTTSQRNSQVRALFQLAGVNYNLTLADSVWEPFISSCGPGLYAPKELGMKDEQQILLTVSLGEPTEFDGACYKLVAAVLETPKLPA